MAVITQRLQVLFELRFLFIQLERGQHAAKIGAVAAVMEQRNIPVRAQRMQEFSTRPVIPETQSCKPLAQGLVGRPPTMYRT